MKKDFWGFLWWNQVERLESELKQSKELVEFNAKKKNSLSEQLFDLAKRSDAKSGEINDLKKTIIEAVELLQIEREKNSLLRDRLKEKKLVDAISKEVSEKLA